jgi:tRNA A37 threonylcarbamoyladenosine biosynthesis protein TsaE
MVQCSQPLSSSEHGRSFLSHLWTPKLKIPLPNFTESSILIAVMGVTGAGKTTFIRNITGLDGMEIGDDLNSCKYDIIA